MVSSVVVLGAGPAGAAAALFLARRGCNVTVVDHDPLPGGPPELWRRRGVAQARQGHAFLAAGTRVLSEEAPDVVEELISRGARRVPLKHSSADWNLLSSRRLFDAAMRDALASEPGVRLLSAVAARGLVLTTASTAAPPHVRGLQTEVGAITADIVVDAGGWRSPVVGWLADAGIKVGIEDDPTCFFYITRHYRLRIGSSFPTLRLPILAALDYATVLAFPEDNDRFQISVQLDLTDPSKRVLRDPVVFENFLARIPLMTPWLEGGEPIGDPEAMASVGNCRKRTFLDRPLVTGLLMAGDAAVHTNPSAARGIALALMHARSLADLVRECAAAYRSPSEVAAQWECATSKLVNPWLASQIAIDRERRMEIRACLQSRACNIGSHIASRIANRLATLHNCEEAEAAAERLFNLLSTPEDIYRDRELMRRILRASRSADQPPTMRGPSRREYERLAGIQHG